MATFLRNFIVNSLLGIVQQIKQFLTLLLADTEAVE